MQGGGIRANIFDHKMLNIYQWSFSAEPTFSILHLNTLVYCCQWEMSDTYDCKSRWDTRTWQVADEGYGLILREISKKKGSSRVPYHPLFSLPSSLFPSAPIFDLTWGLFHTSWAVGMNRDERKCAFSSEPFKTPSGLEPCWGLHSADYPMIFPELWY